MFCGFADIAIISVSKLADKKIKVIAGKSQSHRLYSKMSKLDQINDDADSDFSDDDSYSGDEGYIDLVRNATSNIHGSKTKPYTTSVYLGYVDEPEDSAANFRDSRLGGLPVWLPANSKKGNNVQILQQPPSPELLKCLACGKKMALLVQLYAPLEDTEYERVLYVLVCRNGGACKRAPGSVRVIRGVKRDMDAEKKKVAEAKAAVEAEKKKKEHEEEKERAKKAKLNWADEVEAEQSGAPPINPFGASGGNPFAAADPFANINNPFAPKPAAPAAEIKKESESKKNTKPSFAEVAQKGAPLPPAPAAPVEDDGTPTPRFAESFYLYVEAEELDPMFHKRTLPAGLDPQDLVNLSIDADDLEASTSTDSVKIESAAAEIAAVSATSGSGTADDPAFQKFVDTVSQNPTQVVRYDASGSSALLYSSRDAVTQALASSGPGGANGIPINPLTREPRHVEFQIMPHAITVLEEAEVEAQADADASATQEDRRKKAIQDALTNGMDWGTILVATPVVDTMPGLDETGVAYCEEWVGVQYEQF